jgi:hypothetical protein
VNDGTQSTEKQHYQDNPTSGHNAEAHKAADSITFVADCVECWRERFLVAMWLDRWAKDA